MKEHPFKIKFEDERAIDFGGDMFSAIFTEMYSKVFDGTTLVTPAIHPGTDLSLLPILGGIISHAYLVSGVLPIRIVLLDCCSSFLEEVLLSTFIDSLSIHDGGALKQVKDNLPSFSSEISNGLQLVSINAGKFLALIH